MAELKPKLTKAKDGDARLGLLDIAAMFTIIDRVWAEAFQPDLGKAGRSYVNELSDARNR